jgi:Domain of unknown function (DUF4251)
MKKLFIIFFSLLVMSSCSTTKEANSSKAEARKEKKLLNQELVKNAIESKRYIIKFDKMYVDYGGVRELFPRANFLIVDKEKAILSTAYMGRQYDIKPIAAINIRGRSLDYAVTDNLSKGSYDIKLKVNNTGSNTFDVYIKVSRNGSCNISVSSLKIENVNYSGYLVPISDTTIPDTQMGNPI